MSSIRTPSSILLPDLNESVSADEEAAFFASLHQRNGTTRMTNRGRLDDVNVAIASCLPAHSRVEALDAGVSSGIATIEWLQSLESLGHVCVMTAFDRTLHAHLYSFGDTQLLAEQNGYVFLIHTGRRALTRPIRRTPSWRNRLARIAFKLGDTAAKFARVAGAGRQVSLVSRQLQSRSDVHLVEHDIFKPAPDWISRFHVVRVANLLNLSYFPEQTLRLGLRNAENWVTQGGLLVVARTTSAGKNNSTIFRREVSGLMVVRRLGSGSEIEALINWSVR